MPSSVVSTTTAVRLRELLRRGPLAAPPPVLGSEFGRAPLFVRCTSVTPAGTGVGAQCYPAVVVDLDSSQLVADQPELGNMWLTVIRGGVVTTPTVDEIYEVHMSGEFDPDPTGTSDPRPRVFAAAQSSALQPYGFTTYTATASLTAGTPVLTVPRGDYMAWFQLGVSYAGGAATVHFGLGMRNAGASPGSPKVPTTLGRNDGTSGDYQTITICQYIRAGDSDDDGSTSNVDIVAYMKQTTGSGTTFSAQQTIALRVG